MLLRITAKCCRVFEFERALRHLVARNSGTFANPTRVTPKRGLRAGVVWIQQERPCSHNRQKQSLNTKGSFPKNWGGFQGDIGDMWIYGGGF